MAAAIGSLDDFGCVFGEAKQEQEGDPVLFHAQAQPQSRSICIVATDLHSRAWQRSLSLADIDDLRDDVGIGGSCSDFLHYLKSCFSSPSSASASGEVKLLIPSADAAADSGEVKLVATKAKGLPRITITLHTVAASAVNHAIANFTLSLYAAYTTSQEQASREQDRVSQLTESLASQIEKNEIMQKQLEALSFLDKRKATKPKLVSNQVPSVSNLTQGSDQVIVPVAEQQASGVVASPSKVAVPVKATKRIAPISRRARVRGALLQDIEENNDE